MTGGTGSVPARADDGAGTMLAAAMVGVILFVTVVVSGGVAVVATHRIAQSAADLAALAGAATLQRGGDACAQARAVARQNRARLTACRVAGWQVAVTVVASARVWGALQTLPARARAGPVSDLEALDGLQDSSSRSVVRSSRR